MAGKRHVIVGAGTAGINCIRTLRQLGDTGEITLVSGEPPYSRMVLPYYLEHGISEAHAETVSARQFAKWDVKTHLGVKAAGLDPKANKLKLENGEELEYDDLLIATGSSAARAPIPGADGPGVFSFWTLADAKAVHRRISKDAHVVMVGAGFISFTILNGVLARCGKLTIVEVAPRILPRMVDETGARLATSWLERAGVTVLAGAKLKAVEERGGKPVAVFEDGKALEADLVLMATGIRTNLDWLKDSGLEMRTGLVVDDQLRTSVPNVYAAGDVAESRNLLTGNHEIHAIETTAQEHGRVIGANMAGKAVKFAGSVLMNIVSIAGLDMASFGTWDDANAEAIVGLDEQRGAYRKYLFTGEAMTGAIVVSPSNQTWMENDVGMVKGLVQAGTPLGQWKDFLRRKPFEIKKPFLAARTTAALIPKTTLGGPTPAPWS